MQRRKLRRAAAFRGSERFGDVLHSQKKLVTQSTTAKAWRASKHTYLSLQCGSIPRGRVLEILGNTAKELDYHIKATVLRQVRTYGPANAEGCA
jgi:hypothetical protein